MGRFSGIAMGAGSLPLKGLPPWHRRLLRAPSPLVDLLVDSLVDRPRWRSTETKIRSRWRLIAAEKQASKVALLLPEIILQLRCVRCHKPSRRHLELCVSCQSYLPINGPACIQCAIPLPQAIAVARMRCGSCLNNPPLFDSATALLSYNGWSKDLILDFKQKQQRHLGTLLAELMAHRLITANPSGIPKNTLVVPVPSTRKAWARRGFNPPAEMARRIAFRLSLPTALEALHLPKSSSRRQHGLSARQRQQVAQPQALEAISAPVLLIDDVMTTGATLRKATIALKAAGAPRVDVLIAARTH